MQSKDNEYVTDTTIRNTSISCNNSETVPLSYSEMIAAYCHNACHI